MEDRGAESEINGDKASVSTRPQVSKMIQNGALLFTSNVELDPTKNDIISHGAQNSQERMSQLPSEIAHITQGYMSLQTLLSRLAQKTHSDLIGTLKDLAQVSLPISKANGNASLISTVDDSSAENLAKKLRLLKFTMESHEAWTKALVIMGWSRRAEDVSKIIDLKVHLDQQQLHYLNAIEQMASDKKGLIHARLPNPDLNTALEVMSTGKVSWMPNHGYIPPPLLTARDMLKELEKLNTLLSIRLNLDDYESVPFHFKDFSIKSGRVTFKVVGEFEVDLTIAEEAPDAQFWFLDLRFMFSPSPDGLSPSIRYFIENKINEILLRDGLSGCYNILHDIVMTYKISEFRRQAVSLSRYRWIHSAKAEVLNRSISIQYWCDRYYKIPKSTKTPRNWLLLGVHSGRRRDGQVDSKTTSRLGIRWFRDSKEQKEVEIQFDEVNISAEALLNTVVSKHIAHILGSIYQKLRAKSLYAKRDLSLSLSVSTTEPANSELKVQLTAEHTLSVRIEPVSGLFILHPPIRRILDYQRRLNTVLVDVAGHAHEFIEQLRYQLIVDDLMAHGFTTGWKWLRNPGVKMLEMKRVFTDAAQVHWFRRASWVQGWYLAVSLNMVGENWRLIQTTMTSDPTNPNGIMVIPKQMRMPIRTISPATKYAFMTASSVFAAALISYHENLKAFWSRRFLYMLTPSIEPGPIKLPSIHLRLSELLDSMNRSYRTGKPWARDILKISFQGLEFAPPIEESVPENLASQALLSRRPQHKKNEIAVMVCEARLLKSMPSSVLDSSHGKIDPDIAFNTETGCFAFRLRSKIGETIVSTLIERLTNVERLVESVQVLQKHSKVLKCEAVSLGTISFTYGKIPSRKNENEMQSETPTHKATVEFYSEKNAMALRLEQGNPHLRIADQLTLMLNSHQGLNGVAVLLPLTLPVLQGFEAVEEAWASLPASEHGTVVINVHAADMYILRYNLVQTPQKTDNAEQTRKILFEIRLRQRRGEGWWYIRRHEQPVLEETERSKLDAVDEELALLWKMSGKNWLGMRISAVAQGEGVITLLQKIDDIIQKVSINDKIWAVQIPAQKAPTAPMNVAGLSKHQKPLIWRQSMMPNMSHSQGGMQGRANPLKREREVVEID